MRGDLAGSSGDERRLDDDAARRGGVAGDAGEEQRIVIDRSSVEVFADGGRVSVTDLVLQPGGGRTISLVTTGGAAAQLKATVTPLVG